VRKTRIAVVLLVGVLVVAVLAFAMPTSTVPVAEAVDPCIITGHVFVDGTPVTNGTRIQVPPGGNFSGIDFTGSGCPRPKSLGQAGGPYGPPMPIDVNEYCMWVTESTPVLSSPTQERLGASVNTVNFEIEWDCGGGEVWLMAVETAEYNNEGTVVHQDLHSSCSVGGIIEPVDLLEQSATSGEPSDGASASTFIALGIGIAVLLAALIVWSVRRRRVA